MKKTKIALSVLLLIAMTLGALYSYFLYAAKPAAFAPFSQAVIGASGLVIVTPEYNGSFPGVLKLFIDHLQFPESLDQKPVCFVGLAAGAWGALRSVEQLQVIATYCNAQVFSKRVFLPGIGQALDAAGQCTNPSLVKRLREQAAGFAGYWRRWRWSVAAPGSAVRWLRHPRDCRTSC